MPNICSHTWSQTAGLLASGQHELALQDHSAKLLKTQCSKTHNTVWTKGHPVRRGHTNGNQIPKRSEAVRGWRPACPSHSIPRLSQVPRLQGGKPVHAVVFQSIATLSQTNRHHQHFTNLSWPNSNTEDTGKFCFEKKKNPQFFLFRTLWPHKMCGNV